MELNDINKQAVNDPLSKEELREQFVKLTKELGLKHTFTFEEAWEIAQKLRQKQVFRDNIVKFEEILVNHESSRSKEEISKVNPVKHSFADGCYIREIFNPAHELIVTKIHKKEHPFFLLHGKMSILTEGGVEHLEAPYYNITKPGIKRVIFTHTDCIFVTVHATEYTDIDTIEDDLIAKDFDDPVITIEDYKAIKESIEKDF